MTIRLVGESKQGRAAREGGLGLDYLIHMGDQVYADGEIFV